MTLTFVAFAAMLVVLPGPDTAVILLQGAVSRRSGLATAVGVTFGLCTHTVAAALGVSLLLAQIPAVLTLLRISGALFLLYIGVRMMRAGSRLGVDEAARVNKQAANVPRAFWMGFFTNATNPKSVIVFVTVFPAVLDVDPSAAWPGAPLLVGGLVLIGCAAVWYSLLAVAVAAALKLFSTLRMQSVTRLAGSFTAVLGVAILMDAAWSALPG